MKSVYGAVFALLAILSPSLCRSALEPAGARQSIRLDGTWQVAEGSMERIPPVFDRTAPVPGLADMAMPAFSEVGKKSDKRQAFSCCWICRGGCAAHDGKASSGGTGKIASGFFWRGWPWVLSCCRPGGSCGWAHDTDWRYAHA
jgi:hypothetical protein